MDSGFWHAIEFENRGTMCAALVTEGLSAEFIFGDARSAHELACLSGMKPRVDEENAARAIRWAMDLDGAAAAAVGRGDLVKKAVPVAHPAALPVPNSSSSIEVFWRLRQPVGHLIRPLLLGPPDHSPLFPYQEEGVRWLLDHPVGILADDMGLGKTLQAIAAIQLLVRRGRLREALVICPSTLLANWEEELSRWAPELSRVRLTPARATKEEAWEAVIGRVHVVLTNYEHIRDVPHVLSHRNLSLIVADEAHKVRNLKSLSTRGLRALTHQRFWSLTGTPIERDTEDLATLLSTMSPARFSQADARLVPPALRARARPFMLRRLKSQVLEQLPDVIESTEVLELLPRQRASYRKVMRESIGKSGSKMGEVLRRINQLRTICDYDPSTGQSIKAARIAEILESVVSAGEKAVVFSYLIEPLEILRKSLTQTLGEPALVMLVGSMSLPERELQIARFRQRPEPIVLLASTRIGGEGLTLTEANHVIFFNEWWNPSSNAQARDRVVRIGQERGVRIYRFRCRDTVEEALSRILEEKEDTFAEVVDRLADTKKAEAPEIVKLVGELEHQLGLFEAS